MQAQKATGYKFIRIKETTYTKLAQQGVYKDSMDSILSRLLEKAHSQKGGEVATS